MFECICLYTYICIVHRDRIQLKQVIPKTLLWIFEIVPLDCGRLKIKFIHIFKHLIKITANSHQEKQIKITSSTKLCAI